MKKSKLTTQVILITVLAYILIAIVFYFFFLEAFHFSLLLTPLLLSFTTIWLHGLLIKASEKTPMRFVNQFMMVTGIKLLLYLVFILVFILAWSPYAIPFLIIFFSLYIIFTVLEINELLKFLKTIQTNSK